MRKSGIIAGAILFFALGALAGPVEEAQVEALFDQALLAYEQKKFDSALDLLEQARDLAPNDSQVNLLQGVAFCSAGRFEDAKAPLKRVLKSDPDHLDANANLGIAYFETGRWKQAEKFFQKVLELAPGHAQARVNLGILALKSEDWQAARDHFDEAVRLAPKDPRAWIGLSDALAWMDKNAAAADARRKALALNPRDDEVRLKLAGSLYALGKTDEVLSTLKGMQKSKEPEAHFLLGIAYHRKGRFDRSEKAFLRALELRPQFAKARVNLGISYYDQGEYEKAIEQFELALRDDKSNQEAKESLRVSRGVAVASLTKKGSQAYVQGHFSKAMEYYQRVLDLDPRNKVVKKLVKTAEKRLKAQAEERAAEGKRAMTAGRLEAAIRAWNDALDMDPDNKAALAGLKNAAEDSKGLAAIYEKEVQAALADGAFERAQRQAEEVRRISPSLGKRLLGKIERAQSSRALKFKSRGDSAAKQGRWRDAVEAYDEAVQQDPDDRDLKNKLNRARVSLRRELSKLLEQAEKSKDPKTAYGLYQKALKVDPHSRRAKDGASKTARQAKVSRVDPEEVNAVYYDGVYAYANGETQRAIDLWEKALKLDSKHDQTLQALEEARRKLKAITELDRKR